MKHLFTAVLMVAVLPARAEVLLVRDTGFIVENRIHVDTDAATAWRALVTQVDNWWPKDHSWWLDAGTFSIDPVAGGCFCERNGDSSAEHMRIVFAEPGKLLRMAGGLGPLQGLGMYGAMDWAFAARDSGTDITLTYRVSGINADGFDELAAAVDGVQALQLAGLGNYLARH